MNRGWMRPAAGAAFLGVLLAVTPRDASAAAPAWAYVADPPPAVTPAPDDRTLQRIPGSSAAFTARQIADLFKAPDWYPAEHPAMPQVVATGRAPEVRACAYCHLPNGQGRPENAALAGLPARYIAQQVSDIRRGLRKSSGPASRPHALMFATASHATDAEIQAAAEYFSRLKFRPLIRVVEAATVPKTRSLHYMLQPLPGGGTEPIGTRIIEMPEKPERTELRDSRSGYVAYVPPGSVQQGEALVTRGGAGRTLACWVCHGQDLRGTAIAPPLAGRSPSYVVRQLLDIQAGTRHGAGSQLMQPVVAKLALGDVVAIAAYIGSRTP